SKTVLPSTSWMRTVKRGSCRSFHVMDADRQARILPGPIQSDGNESAFQPQEAMIFWVVLLFLDGVGIGHGAATELPQTRLRVNRMILPVPVTVDGDEIRQLFVVHP